MQRRYRYPYDHRPRRRWHGMTAYGVFWLVLGAALWTLGVLWLGNWFGRGMA